jgi:hypothetical protein
MAREFCGFLLFGVGFSFCIVSGNVGFGPPVGLMHRIGVGVFTGCWEMVMEVRFIPR